VYRLGGVVVSRISEEGERVVVEAVVAASTGAWSTGPVEGQITRLKLVKRQGYGCCGLDTLKRRFLRVA
jgi:transposase